MSPGHLKLKVLRFAAQEISEQASFYESRSGPIEGFPKHLVFYRFDAATSTVIILRVLHGARDIPALLEGGGKE